MEVAGIGRTGKLGPEKEEPMEEGNPLPSGKDPTSGTRGRVEPPNFDKKKRSPWDSLSGANRKKKAEAILIGLNTTKESKQNSPITHLKGLGGSIVQNFRNTIFRLVECIPSGATSKY